MKIDIFDTTVPDYSILDKKSLMESLGYESETSLRNAVDSGFIPPSMDYGGRNGAGRWTVGMIRKWFMLKGEKAVDDALRRLNYVSKMSVSQKNAFPLNDARRGTIRGTKQMTTTKCPATQHSATSASK